MRLTGILNRRVRGFRVVDLGAMVVVLALALTVYAFKTSAGAQRTDIADIENQIHDQSQQVRILRAEVARLERPQRLERLATDYADEAPVTARQVITAAELPQVAASGSAAP